MPVIPISGKRDQAECQGCFGRFDGQSVATGLGDSARFVAPQHATISDGDVRDPLSDPDGPAKLAGPNSPSLAAIPQVSSLAVASLVTAILSPFLILACGLSLVSSIAAIVTGHMAVAAITRSGGLLRGTGMARCGLAGGYLFAVLSVAVIGWFAHVIRIEEPRTTMADANPKIEPFDAADAASRLSDAEALVMSAGSDVADRNTEQAPSSALPTAAAPAAKVAAEPRPTGRADEPVGQPPGMAAGPSAFGPSSVPIRPSSVPIGPSSVPIGPSSVPIGPSSVPIGPRSSGMAPGLAPVAPVPIPGGARSAPIPSPPRPPDIAFRPRPRRDPANPTPIAARPSQTGQTPATDPTVDAPVASRPTRSDRPVLERGAGGSSGSKRNQSSSVESPPANLLGQFPDLGWAVKSLAFSPDGRFLAAGKQDRTLLIFDVRSFQVADRRDDLRQLDQVTGVAFSNDGERLVATGTRGNHVAWAIDSTGGLGPAAELTPSADGARSLVSSPAADFVAIGGTRGEIRWQAQDASRSAAKRLAVLDQPVLAIHLPLSGFSALASDGSSLLRFDLRRAAVTDQTQLGRGRAMAAAFSPNGDRVALCAGAEIRVFETDRGELEQTLSASRETQWSVAFVPGGERLVTGGRGQVTLWDLENATPLQRFNLGGVSYIQTLAVSPDGTQLAAVPSAAGQTLSVFRLGSEG